MKAVPRSAAVVFAYLCICWAAGSVFLAMIYDYDDLALYLVFLRFLFPFLGVFGALLWLSTPCGATKPPTLRQKVWRASNVGSVLDYSGASQSLGGHYFFGSGTYP